MNIEEIKDPKFLKTLSIDELNKLSDDIRDFLIKNISLTGGHLSSNLGVVELSIAMHYVFDSPIDKIIFDVGHQCYTHKILTGRAKDFVNLRKYKGISGFQKRCESPHDVFEAGHSSTSIAGALGFAIKRDLDKENYEVIAVIGDGSLTGGLAFEALNNISNLNTKVIIILNDNTYSISKNIGGMSDILSKIRLSNTYNKAKEGYKELMTSTKVGNDIYSISKNIKDNFKKKINDNIFTEFALDYLGPIDGHDIQDLIKALTKAKENNTSTLIHAVTTKGKGYQFAIDNPTLYHGVSKFDVNKGVCSNNSISYSKVVSDTILEFMENDEDIICITPAMKEGSKLEKIFERFPNRSFDTGITEGFATTFASALGINNKKVFLPIYSSFLQRAYDNINHDIARMDSHVVIGIDRAGLVGEDGPTHHGVFDISFLNAIPNIVIAMGKDSNEIRNLLYTAFYKQKHPFCIRYERGNTTNSNIKPKAIKVGSWSYLKKSNSNKHIISYGPDINKLYEIFKEEDINIINARFIKPMDTKLLDSLNNKENMIYIYESSLESNGLGANIIVYLNKLGFRGKIKNVGIKEEFIEGGDIISLKKSINLDMEYISEDINKFFKRKKVS